MATDISSRNVSEAGQTGEVDSPSPSVAAIESVAGRMVEIGSLPSKPGTEKESKDEMAPYCS